MAPAVRVEQEERVCLLPLCMPTIHFSTCMLLYAISFPVYEQTVCSLPTTLCWVGIVLWRFERRGHVNNMYCAGACLHWRSGGGLCRWEACLLPALPCLSLEPSPFWPSVTGHSATGAWNSRQEEQTFGVPVLCCLPTTIYTCDTLLLCHCPTMPACLHC
jgi:hypothetical protein